MRINKYLTSANYCSRREADRLIEKKKVKINNTVAQLGQQVETGDRVFVGKKEVLLEGTKKIYLAFHKPVGVICTSDTTKPDNIIEAVGYPERVYPVGRLDVASSGIILMTNDGDVVNAMLKGKNKVEKEYLVDVDVLVTDEKIKKLEKGVVVDGHKTLPSKVKKLDPKRFSITIVEGKNRQVRRMCEKVGLTAKRLHRVRVGKYRLLNLKRGEYRELRTIEP